jgi:isopentenyl-diphosphate delta-isomerase
MYNRPNPTSGNQDLIPAWVDGDLRPLEKLAVHQQGLRHPAISVFVMADDGSGRSLLQRRALGKYHTPGLWANACCSHPHWQEPPIVAAQRRVGQELGLNDMEMVHLGVQEYRADVGSGLIEHEVVDLFMGYLPPSRPVPFNRSEVMAVEWVALDDLPARMAADPQIYTPWLHIYMAQNWGQRLLAAAKPLRIGVA